MQEIRQRGEKPGMSSVERRAELMRIMICRRKSNIHELAKELNVSTRTIQRDIQALVLDYPIESISGNRGGISLPDWYHPHRKLFSKKQTQVLKFLIQLADEQQKTVLNQIIADYPLVECEGTTRIKETRTMANMTIEELAERSGISVDVIEYIEKTERSTISEAIKLSDALGVEFREICTPDDEDDYDE